MIGLLNVERPCFGNHKGNVLASLFWMPNLNGNVKKDKIIVWERHIRKGVVKADNCVGRTFSSAHVKHFASLKLGQKERPRPVIVLTSWGEGLHGLDEAEIQAARLACAQPIRLSDDAKVFSDDKRVQAQNFESADTPAGSQLSQIDVKCEEPENALPQVIDENRQHNLLSWNSKIRECVRLGRSKDALQNFDHMQREGIRPDRVTFIHILAACGRHARLSEGKRIHVCMQDRGFDSDVILATALIKMYGKCGSALNAYDVFDQMPHRDVIAWTALITVYAQISQSQMVFQLFNQMQEEGILPDKFTLVSILDVCANDAILTEGKRMHARTWDREVSADVVVANAIVNLYGKCGSVQDAQTVFDEMLIQNLVSWTGMIAVCAQLGHSKEALHLFDQMQTEGVLPDKVTFVSLLDACASQGTLPDGQRMHARISEKGMKSNLILGNSIINMYGKCGSVEGAWIMFDNMIKKDLISWNAMIALYAQHGLGKEALHAFNQMLWEGIMPDRVTFATIISSCASLANLPEGKRMHTCILNNGFESDAIVATALVNMYGKCGDIADAHMIFDQIREHDVVSWTAITAVYLQHGQVKDTFQVFDQMQQEGFVPDKAVFVSTLAVCADQVTLSDGKQVHICILDAGLESDIIIGNALINVYGKCGSLEDAKKVFDKMQQQNIVSWNGMITAYAMYGQAGDAFKLFHQMQQEGMQPDKVTFISMFAACSHAGLLEEGYGYCTSMTKDYGIPPEIDHCVCIIDLLGRAGLLEEAEKMIINIPLQPTVVPFMALLAACSYRTDVERCECIAKYVFELDPISTAPFVVLSNIYADAGRGDDVVKVLCQMNDKGWMDQREAGE